MRKLCTELPEAMQRRLQIAGRRSAGLWLMMYLLVALGPVSGQPALFPQPDPSWNCTDDSDSLSTFTDCTGAANQTDDQGPTFDLGIPALCQNYNGSGNQRDVYETLRYPTGTTPCASSGQSTNGACDADIWKYKVGNDADFSYFELETVETWNYDSTGAGRDFILLLDTDSPAESEREDLYYFYDTATTHVVSSAGTDGTLGTTDDNCDTDVGGLPTGGGPDGGGNWQASDETSPIAPHRDVAGADADKAGSTNTTTCDAPGANLSGTPPVPPCLSEDGGSSGFNSDWKNVGGKSTGDGDQSWNWYRIVERLGTLPGPDHLIDTGDDVTGPKRFMQMAIRRNTQCSSGSANCTAPTSLTTRACTSQSSSLGKDNFTWHDHQKPEDLPTWDYMGPRLHLPFGGLRLAGVRRRADSVCGHCRWRQRSPRMGDRIGGG